MLKVCRIPGPIACSKTKMVHLDKVRTIFIISCSLVPLSCKGEGNHGGQEMAVITVQ